MGDVAHGTLCDRTVACETFNKRLKDCRSGFALCHDKAKVYFEITEGRGEVRANLPDIPFIHLAIAVFRLIKCNQYDTPRESSPLGCICNVLNDLENGLSTNRTALLSFSARIKYLADTPYCRVPQPNLGVRTIALAGPITVRAVSFVLWFTSGRGRDARRCAWSSFF